MSELYRRLLPLIGIIAAAWLLVFAGAFIIFRVIVPLPTPSPVGFAPLFTSVVKVSLSALLVAVWIYIMLILRDIYVKRRIILPHREDG